MHTPQRLLLALHSWGESQMFVPSILARTGFPVDAVITPDHPLRSVRRIERMFVAAEGAWAEAIETRLLTGEYTRFYNSDEPGLRTIYRRTWQPEAARFLPLAPESPVAAAIFSKKVFCDWCLGAGLPVPETHLCSGFREALALQGSLPGSWLLKGDRGWGGSSVMRRESEAVFEIEENEPWLVQRDEGHEAGSCMFFAERGQLLAWMGTRSLLCLNNGYGPTILGRGDPSPELGDLCRRVAEASGVTGLTGFDFVWSPERGPVIIDSHLGRICAIMHFDHLYGVDFSTALRDRIEGRDRPVATPAEGPYFIKFPEVLQLVATGGLGNLLKMLDKPVRMPLCPPDDPLIGLRRAFNSVQSQLRVNFGKWRRDVFRKVFSPGQAT